MIPMRMHPRAKKLRSKRSSPTAGHTRGGRTAFEQLEDRRLLAVENELFAASLYTQLLGHVADPPGLNYGTTRLDSGIPRALLARDFLHATESLTRTVDALYHDYLGRVADDGGRAYFIGRLEAGASVIDVQSEILGSDEYVAAQG